MPRSFIKEYLKIRPCGLNNQKITSVYQEKGIILKNIKPTRSFKDDNESDNKESSALDSLGLKPKPAV